MSASEHNIYVVLTGDNRGRLVRKGGHASTATAGFHYTSPVEEAVVHGCEHKDNLAFVGCVDQATWDGNSDLGVLAREGVRRTAEHVLSEQEAAR